VALEGTELFFPSTVIFVLRTLGGDSKYPFTGGAEVFVGTVEGTTGFVSVGTEGG